MKEFDQKAEDAHMQHYCSMVAQGLQPRLDIIPDMGGAMLTELDEFILWQGERKNERDRQAREQKVTLDEIQEMAGNGKLEKFLDDLGIPPVT